MKFKVIKYGLTTTLATYLGFTFISNSSNIDCKKKKNKTDLDNNCGIPTYNEQMQAIQSGKEYDILVIGGGVTGAGCALDAVTRGLKTALVEAEDFASKTSSRSSKLIHGGIRYLQAAIMKLDIEQFKMVKEAISERSILINNCPHLAKFMPILIPIYSLWEIPYYWLGMKLYDLIAGFKFFKLSHYVSKCKALELFPVLNTKDLRGGIIYYDGVHDDARMNLCIALTAAKYGANIVNYVEVQEFLKNGEGKVCGVRVKDKLTDKEFNIKAKCIINATGPYTDKIRKMADPDIKNICACSCGAHIVLPGYITAEKIGLVNPSTPDGSVLFVIPWEKYTLVGTTDAYCGPLINPAATEQEILCLINGLKAFLNYDINLERKDVLSAWCGVRPLVRDPKVTSTKVLLRNHLILVSESNLITIAGGKWTTYRRMAEETIDKAIKIGGFTPKCNRSQTLNLKLDGSQKWSPTLYIKLIQAYNLEEDIAKHLSSKYGTRAYDLLSNDCETATLLKRIHPDFPYTELEIRYCVKEYANTAIDMIARRTRLAFVNTAVALEILPIIVNIMGDELNWSQDENKRQLLKATEFILKDMGHFKSDPKYSNNASP